MSDVSNARVRLEGHLALLFLPCLMTVIALVRAQRPNGFDPLALILGIFPAGVGWLCAVIAFEIGVARGRGRAAIRSSVSVCALVAFVNLILVLVLFHYLKLA